VHVVGESASETMVVTDHAVISVEAEATHIPEFVEVSVEGAEIGTQIFAKDLELPKGSTLQTDDEALIVNVIHAPTADELEEELAEAEAEVGIEREEAPEEAPEEAAPAEAAAEGGEEQPEE
jgi:large subunit ribosomal protein L25